MPGELVGDRDNVGTDVVNGRRKHNRRSGSTESQQVQIAIEIAAAP